MKTRMIFMTLCLTLLSMSAYADQTVTVTATNTDISENLDLKTVATLFGQAKDLEEFEQMLNNPDSAFSNLDLNGDGNVDYLRVIETADQQRHLIVIQAVLAKDIYQDVASIFVEKDPESESVTVQVIGDEYIYGADYIIEPVYIYRPLIYDWFWGPSWVCWHSPYYWDYWPTWWHPYHCIAYHLYWDHCYWHHHYHPICSYRIGHHYHPHYQPMRSAVSRTDYATRHPERSFASRNVNTRYTNARDFDHNRQTTMRATAGRGAANATTRVSNRSAAQATRTFGSTNVRTNDRITNSVNRTASRVEATTSRGQATTSRSNSNTTSRSTSVTTTTRSTTPSVSRTSNAATTRSNSSTMRSTSSSTRPASSSSTMRSSSSSSTRSSGSTVRSSGGGSTMRSGGGSTMRTSGGGSSSRGGGGSTRR